MNIVVLKLSLVFFYIKYQKTPHAVHFRQQKVY